MKNRNGLKGLSWFFALAIIVSVMTSCNRGGQGCPNNFKINPITSISLLK